MIISIIIIVSIIFLASFISSEANSWLMAAVDPIGGIISPYRVNSTTLMIPSRVKLALSSHVASVGPIELLPSLQLQLLEANMHLVPNYYMERIRGVKRNAIHANLMTMYNTSRGDNMASLYFLSKALDGVGPMLICLLVAGARTDIGTRHSIPQDVLINARFLFTIFLDQHKIPGSTALTPISLSLTPSL